MGTRLTKAFFTIAICGALGIAACGDDDDGGTGPGGNTSNFVGIFSSDDASESGSLTITVQTANPMVGGIRTMALVPVDVTGTLTLTGGGTVALTGTYDPDTGDLDVSGGGYSFSGVFDGTSRLEGTYTGPTTSGTFILSLDDNTSASAYCGTYEADDLSDDGTFSFVIDGNVLLGEAVSSQDGTNIPLDGTVSGSNITIFIPGTQQTLATGTISGTNVSGTFDDQQGTTGTWQGSQCD